MNFLLGELEKAVGTLLAHYWFWISASRSTNSASFRIES
jgi:hypothetical protein